MNQEENGGAGRNAERSAQLGRLRHLYERWFRWSWQPLGKAGWEAVVSDNLGAIVILIGLGFSIAFTPFDLGIWIPRLEPYNLGIWALKSAPEVLALVRWVPPATWAGTLLGLFLVNGWAVDRLLARWDRPGRLALQKQALRFLLGGLPLVGLGFPPIWQTALRRRQEAEKEDRENDNRDLGFAPAPRPAESLLQGLDRAARNLSFQHLGALFLANAMVVFAGGLAVAFPREPDPGRALLVVSLWAILHLLAWVNMSYWLALLARRSPRPPLSVRGGRCLALLWLIPVPYMAAFGAIWLMVRCVLRQAGQQTLTHTLYERRQSLRHLPVWSGLETNLRAGFSSATWWRRWQDRPQELETPEARPRADEEILRLCRRKSLALGFEAALLVWIGAFLGQELELAETFQALFRVAFLLPLAIAGLGLLTLLGRFLAYWGRAGGASGNSDPYSWVSALVTSELAWAGGLLAGVELFRRNDAGLGATILLIGVVGLLLQAGPVLLRFFVSVPLPVQRDIRREAPWLLLFSAFLVCGLSMAKGEDHGIYAILVLLVVLLSPLWSVVVGALSVGWMLRPWRARDLLVGKLSGKRRLLLGLVTLTVLTPFGGLVSPFWVFLRPSSGKATQTGGGAR